MLDNSLVAEGLALALADAIMKSRSPLCTPTLACQCIALTCYLPLDTAMLFLRRPGSRVEA